MNLRDIARSMACAEERQQLVRAHDKDRHRARTANPRHCSWIAVTRLLDPALSIIKQITWYEPIA
jgi:hypothetical protein